jgi:gliding motility-associated lipoprotein GldB
MKHLFSIIIVLLLASCSSEKKTEKEIEAIPVTIELLRFDTIFGKATENDLPKLKSKYPEFFPKQYHDSVWFNRINDTFQKQLFEEVIRKYPTNENLEEQFTSLFQHIKYYFPIIKIPRVITSIDFVDYKNNVILTDENLLVSLDTYLGSEHSFYEGIPMYISQNMKESQIISDVSSAYAKQFVSMPVERTFLAQMMYHGKVLYLKDLWIPKGSDAVKRGYTQGQVDWMLENEAEIWRNFVENEVLFSTDAKLLPRFIYPAPFSKFYLEIDNESPGRVGQYMGWQIVRSFMEKNNIDLQQLMMMNADEIFNASKYKPKK